MRKPGLHGWRDARCHGYHVVIVTTASPNTKDEQGERVPKHIETERTDPPPVNGSPGRGGNAITDGNDSAGVPLSSTSETSTGTEIALASPELYLNRELTWLSFNRRVLAEAEDERNPLLERLKFLAISASNLDEFFIKRIGGLKQQAASGVKALTIDGRTPQTQIAECLETIRHQEQSQ